MFKNFKFCNKNIIKHISNNCYENRILKQMNVFFK